MDEKPLFPYALRMSMRLFLAMPLPPAVRDALADVMSQMRRSVRARVRWAPADGIHATLHFLGQQDDGVVSLLDERIAPVAGRFHAAEARLGPVGFFPDPAHPRVVWVGMEEAGKTLVALREHLGREIHELGLEVDPRPWSPHLTLARLDVPLPANAFVATVPDVRFLVDRFCLYRSDLTPGGAKYTALRTYPLAAV